MSSRLFRLLVVSAVLASLLLFTFVSETNDVRISVKTHAGKEGTRPRERASNHAIPAKVAKASNPVSAEISAIHTSLETTDEQFVPMAVGKSNQKATARTPYTLLSDAQKTRIRTFLRSGSDWERAMTYAELLVASTNVWKTLHCVLNDNSPAPFALLLAKTGTRHTISILTEEYTSTSSSCRKIMHTRPQTTIIAKEKGDLPYCHAIVRASYIHVISLLREIHEKRRVLSLVRDPVERFLSEFSFRSGFSTLKNATKWRQLSIMVDTEFYANYEVASLVGKRAVVHSELLRGEGVPTSPHCRDEIFVASEADLTQISEWMSRGSLLLGVTERYEETVRMWEDCFGWRAHSSESLNPRILRAHSDAVKTLSNDRNAHALRRSDIPEGFVARIEAVSWLDRRLHDMANTFLDEWLARKIGT